MDLEDKIRALFWNEMDQHSKNSLHDAVFNALDKEIDDTTLYSIFRTIPFNIICDALKWSCSDTEVKEMVYEHVEKNYV